MCQGFDCKILFATSCCILQEILKIFIIIMPRLELSDNAQFFQKNS